MNLDRRTVLRVAAVGAASPLAGCLGDGGDGDGDGTPTTSPTGTPGETPTDTPGGSGPSITGHETLAFTVRSSAPEWYDDEEEPRGHAIAIDSENRQRAAFDPYDLSEEREAEVEEFLEDVDYGTDRLVLLESVGPDTCHDQLDVSDVRVEDDALAASATVVDTSESGEACGDAITYPSTLLAVTFEDDPLDEVSVEFTDGWGETATVTASVDDPLPAQDPGKQSGYVRPDTEPEPIAPLSCEDDGVRRHDQWYEESAVQWGDFADADHGDGEAYLALRVDDLEYARGDTARIELTNVDDEPVETGNRHKFNFQAFTEDGWQDVRVLDDGGHFGYTDEAIEHEPGEGFTWTVELTESGIIEAGTHDEARVCPDLQAGRYRFAYFGVIGDGAVAVSFDLS